MKYTPILNLKKPELTDPVDIRDINGNMDIIEQTIGTHLADYVRQPGYGVTAGTSTAYTITLNPAPTAYADGQQFIINPHVDCGANPTLNVNAMGAGTILKQDGSAVTAGEIKANKPLSLVRVGSSFFIRSAGGSNIKSKQSGTLSFSKSSNNQAITISPVDLTKSIVRITYASPSPGGGCGAFVCEFGNASSITISRQNPDNIAPTLLYWEVIEFNNVKSLQTGYVSCTTANESTYAPAFITTVSPVNMSKTMIFSSAYKGSSGNDGTNQILYRIFLGASDKMYTEYYANGMTYTMYVKYFLIEFN